MLIQDEKHNRGKVSPIQQCAYCSRPLSYPVVVVASPAIAYHAACATELAAKLLQDIDTLVHPLQEEPPSPMAAAFRAAALQGAPTET